MKFGTYLKMIRQENGITLRSFADQLGKAPSYISDIEKGKRNPPQEELLKQMADLLLLDPEKRNNFFDLAAKGREELSPDITQYVNHNEKVRVALRKARELQLEDEDWLKIIEMMEKEKK